MIRVVPLWPRARYIELAPKYSAATRARLNPDELVHELGPLTVPPPAAAEQQRPPSWWRLRHHPDLSFSVEKIGRLERRDDRPDDVA